jgi:hypothetical protein
MNKYERLWLRVTALLYAVKYSHTFKNGLNWVALANFYDAQ